MILRTRATQPRSVAGDGSHLVELLHPKREAGAFPLRASIAHARLDAGEFTTPHLLKDSSEAYYIICGPGKDALRG